MKRIRVVYLLLILCLVLGMFTGCTGDKGSLQKDASNSSENLIVDEGNIDDPFDE